MIMEWIRCEEIGHGSFATVSKAKSTNSLSGLPPIIAVKSIETIFSASSDSLKNEKSVLDKIGDQCPQIIKCFGDQITTEENNKSFYNLLLEYASNGTLADQVKLAGGKLPEIEVRRHTKSVLKGLAFLHAKGFVHCDVKLQNVLVFGDGGSKLADFGLAKKKNEKVARCELRGTPLYLSPEIVNDAVYESPCDVWGLGCAVAEMSVGRPVWAHKPGSSVWPLLMRIAGKDENPEIASEISEEGKDFLRKCFVKDPSQRWTAEMLLTHPFVSNLADDSFKVNQQESTTSSSSPRCPFEFAEWVSESSSSAMDQLRKLVFGYELRHDWSVSESWVTIRDC